MTKQEFLETEKPLVFIISVEPNTGKVLYDTYDYQTAEGWVAEIKKDFPDMITFSMLNPAAVKVRLKLFGLTK